MLQGQALKYRQRNRVRAMRMRAEGDTARAAAGNRAKH